MPKMKRSELKSIIKECLVEILSEGIGYSDEYDDHEDQPIKEKRNFGSNSDMIEKMQSRKKMLNEKITYNKKQSKQQNHDHLVNGVTTDPMMAEIFRDTAQTTLVEQGMANKAGPKYTPADGAARALGDHNPGDIFSGGDNWATLAFSSGKKNR